MAEIPGAPHDEVCAKATGHICVCACRGTLHGVDSRSGPLRRMAEVAVTARDHTHPLAPHLTPAQRRQHPVVLIPADHAVSVHHGSGPTVTGHTAAVPHDFSGTSDEELLRHFDAASHSGDDAAAQRVYDEMGRREAAAKATLPPYQLPKPAHTMSDRELGEAAHHASGEAFNEAALRDVYAEMDRREAEQQRYAELAKTPPTDMPAVRSGIFAFEQLRGRGHADPAVADRVARAERLMYGVDQDATPAALAEAHAADPRPAEQRSLLALAWYRKLAGADGILPGQDAYGEQDDPRIVHQREQAAALAAAEQARQSAIGAGPTRPVRVQNPIAEWGDVKFWSGAMGSEPGTGASQDRIMEAQRRVHGLGPNAGDKEIRAVERADTRHPAEVAAQYLTWYRHLGQHAEPGTEMSQDWQRGPEDHPTAPTVREAMTPANVAKPWDTWQTIKDQAKADQAAGNPQTWARYVAAMKTAYGLPDTAPDSEISRAHRHDTRTPNQQAAGFIAAYRQSAGHAGIDPADTLRHGPLDRNAGRNKTLPTQWRDSSPEQTARIDELVARGMDYVDAYADVHNVDPAQLKAQQAAGIVDRGAGQTTDQAVRRQYDHHVHLMYVAAETATRGHLLSSAGKTAGVDPVSLFSGPTARARKYASEDLLRWWHDNGGRTTFTQFRAQVLGKTADKAAAKITAMAAQGKDFG